ncbi:hypothetical protein NDU88_004223 [Pleurodeles waltl]|uniref:NmrA-like family domain-containing protein 1 n=1 Tax=Pleurodeles waltl TaxID=8319 RepID=A0AAV7V2Z4_PLEWA|nr:hypothetical protein NDU88_004223 [Pleurodeles waltl]
MASRKLITVFGATGAQGGSVARALLGKPDFAVRAATRDVKRPSSLALRDLGATVVQGDLDSEKSVEEVMGGAHGVFLVTNFYEGFSKEKEIRQQAGSHLTPKWALNPQGLSPMGCIVGIECVEGDCHTSTAQGGVGAACQSGVVGERARLDPVSPSACCFAITPDHKSESHRLTGDGVVDFQDKAFLRFASTIVRSTDLLIGLRAAVQALMPDKQCCCPCGKGCPERL